MSPNTLVLTLIWIRVEVSKCAGQPIEEVMNWDWSGIEVGSEWDQSGIRWESSDSDIRAERGHLNPLVPCSNSW